MPTGIGGQEKAQMSALEQKVNSGRISDVSPQISDQMQSAFAALARKHRVPDAQFAIYPWRFNYIGAVFWVRSDAALRTIRFMQRIWMAEDRRCHMSCRILLPMS
jgi:hypothetical protein